MESVRVFSWHFGHIAYGLRCIERKKEMRIRCVSAFTVFGSSCNFVLLFFGAFFAKLSATTNGWARLKLLDQIGDVIRFIIANTVT